MRGGAAVVLELMITRPDGTVRFDTRIGKLEWTTAGPVIPGAVVLDIGKDLNAGEEVEIDWRIPGTKLHGEMTVRAKLAEGRG
jgi:hypothetical protein